MEHLKYKTIFASSLL